jgi:trehalose 2-sulfotransferase
MTASSSGPSVPPIRLSYLICTTPRSGSNFLCEVLQSTGVAGRPDEYFWHPPIWEEEWSTADFAAYLERVLYTGTSAEGVFGVKLIWHYLDDLLPRLAEVAGLVGADPPTILSATFRNPRYVWLTRRDKVRQGISWYRALESNAWRSTDRATGPDADPAFDFAAIDHLVRQAVADDHSWQAYFERHAIGPLLLTYEDLAADPGSVALQILRYLGLPSPVAPWPPAWRHQRQSDARTEDWARQYHALAKAQTSQPAFNPAPPLRAREGAGG